MLADMEMRWKIYINPTLPPVSMHSLAQTSEDGRLPIDEVTNAESYVLLCSQLRAATEKRASQLSRSVMNDLERRLLQRQQSGWFETFLVAVITLNCVERACWLFRTWDDENFAQRVSPPIHNSYPFGNITSLTCSGSGPWINAPLTTQTKATSSRTSSICYSKCAVYHQRQLRDRITVS